MAVAGSFLLAAGCSHPPADRAGSSATVATEPAPTTTTNPYAVPAVIDVAYVNRVLAGLDAAIGDITRLVVRTKTIPPEAYDRLKALYESGDFLQIKIDGYQRDIREGFKSYLANPGDKVSTVNEFISARPSCIFVRVHRDYSSVGTNPVSQLEIQWVGLRPLDSSRDPKGYNVTRWAYVYDGFTQDRLRPVDPCAS